MKEAAKTCKAQNEAEKNGKQRLSERDFPSDGSYCCDIWCESRSNGSHKNTERAAKIVGENFETLRRALREVEEAGAAAPDYTEELIEAVLDSWAVAALTKDATPQSAKYMQKIIDACKQEFASSLSSLVLVCLSFRTWADEVLGSSTRDRTRCFYKFVIKHYASAVIHADVRVTPAVCQIYTFVACKYFHYGVMAHYARIEEETIRQKKEEIRRDNAGHERCTILLRDVRACTRDLTGACTSLLTEAEGLCNRLNRELQGVEVADQRRRDAEQDLGRAADQRLDTLRTREQELGRAAEERLENLRATEQELERAAVERLKALRDTEQEIARAAEERHSMLKDREQELGRAAEERLKTLRDTEQEIGRAAEERLKKLRDIEQECERAAGERLHTEQASVVDRQRCCCCCCSRYDILQREQQQARDSLAAADERYNSILKQLGATRQELTSAREHARELTEERDRVTQQEQIHGWVLAEMQLRTSREDLIKLQAHAKKAEKELQIAKANSKGSYYRYCSDALRELIKRDEVNARRRCEELQEKIERAQRDQEEQERKWRVLFSEHPPVPKPVPEEYSPARVSCVIPYRLAENVVTQQEREVNGPLMVIGTTKLLGRRPRPIARH